MRCLDGADPDTAGEAVGGEAEAVTAAEAVVWELTRAGLARIDEAG